MNSLEFIEKEIKYEKENIKLWTPKKETSERLNHLHQIKTILEAWEVVKPKIKFEDLGEMQNGNMYRGYFDDCFDEEEYNKTEKALEVKDE